MIDEMLNHTGSLSGAFVIPDLRLVMCAMPKAGSTTIRWIMLSLLRNLLPGEAICHPGNGLLLQHPRLGHFNEAPPHVLWHFDVSRQNRLRAKALAGPAARANASSTLTAEERAAAWAAAAWEGVELLSEARPETLKSAFLSRDWTTIAFVRDPFARAISSYLDQIGRGYSNCNEAQTPLSPVFLHI